MPAGKLIRIPPEIDYDQSNFLLDRYIKLIAEGEQNIIKMKKERTELVKHIDFLDEKRKDRNFVQQFTKKSDRSKPEWNYSGAFWRDAEVAQANV